MLIENEKLLVAEAMKMFDSSFSGEDLIKQTARYVSGKITTWKRKLVYDFSREYYATETKIMIQTEELGILERFDKVHCSNARYCAIVEEDNSTIRKALKTLSERGIREEQVYMFYDDTRDIDEREEHDSNQDIDEQKVRRIYYWSDELYETNPEWFI